MGSSIFNLEEELELMKSISRIQNRTEGKIFAIACFFILLLKMCNIITLNQFFGLFIFYIFWMNCSVLYNKTIYNKIEKKHI